MVSESSHTIVIDYRIDWEGCKWAGHLLTFEAVLYSAIPFRCPGVAGPSGQ
jgi:hypothetical protein